MGHGYKGDTGHYHTISENIPSVTSKFKYSNASGYFGDKARASNGKPGKNNKVREIFSDDPVSTAKVFYDKVAHGGREEVLSNGEGLRTIMKDGSVLTYREVSHSANGSPAVDINISTIDRSGVKTQKIHFVKE